MTLFCLQKPRWGVYSPVSLIFKLQKDVNNTYCCHENLYFAVLIQSSLFSFYKLVFIFTMSKDHKTQWDSSSLLVELKTCLSAVWRSYQTTDVTPFFSQFPETTNKNVDCNKKTLDTTRWDLIVNKEIEEFFFSL